MVGKRSKFLMAKASIIMIRAAVAALVMLFLLSGCSSVSQPPNRGAATFAVQPGEIKIFLYVAYDNADDRPYFNKTFRAYIDNDYIGDVNVDQFIEMKIAPGNHTFDFYEIGWSSKVLDHSTAKLRLEPGNIYFIRNDMMPDEKAKLSSVSAEIGQKDVMSRTFECLCSTELGRFIDNFQR